MDFYYAYTWIQNLIENILKIGEWNKFIKN